jgi:hypothetical protein
VIWQSEFRTSKLCSNCHNCVKEHSIHSWCKPAYKRKPASVAPPSSSVAPPSSSSSVPSSSSSSVPSSSSSSPALIVQSSPIVYPVRVKPVKVWRVNEPWGIRICPNKLCRILWNRDLNASINMIDLFLNDCGIVIKHRDMSRFSRTTPAADLEAII